MKALWAEASLPCWHANSYSRLLVCEGTWITVKSWRLPITARLPGVCDNTVAPMERVSSLETAQCVCVRV